MPVELEVVSVDVDGDEVKAEVLVAVEKELSDALEVGKRIREDFVQVERLVRTIERKLCFVDESSLLVEQLDVQHRGRLWNRGVGV